MKTFELTLTIKTNGNLSTDELVRRFQRMQSKTDNMVLYEFFNGDCYQNGIKATEIKENQTPAIPQPRNKWGQFRKPMIFCPAAPFVPRIVNPPPVKEKKTIFYGSFVNKFLGWCALFVGIIILTKIFWCLILHSH